MPQLPHFRRSGYYTTTMLKNAYTREGYRFAGWSTNADGTGEWYNDCDGPMWQGDVTLYAQWEKIDQARAT